MSPWPLAHRASSGPHSPAALGRFDESDVCIAVGHCKYFQRMFREYIGPQVHPDLAHMCTQGKLCNAGCVRVQFDFSGPWPAILDVEPMFGTEFIVKENHK